VFSINSIRKQLAKGKRNTVGKTVLKFDQNVFQTAQLLRDMQIISVQKQYTAGEKSQRQKTYTAVILGQKGLRYSNNHYVTYTSHCFRFNNQI